MREFDIEMSVIQRNALENVRRKMSAEQLGEAFRDLPTKPLLTSLVPSGIASPLLKKAPQPKPSIRKVAPDAAVKAMRFYNGEA